MPIADPAVMLRVADAVVETLNAAELSEQLFAERKYVPVSELKKLGTLRVTVVPTEVEMVAISRRDHDFDYTIDLGVQRKTDQSLDDLDSLVRLVEEIVDLFRGKRLALFDDARCVETAIAPVFNPTHIDEEGVFTSVVRLTFRVARPIIHG